MPSAGMATSRRLRVVLLAAAAAAVAACGSDKPLVAAPPLPSASLPTSAASSAPAPSTAAPAPSSAAPAPRRSVSPSPRAAGTATGSRGERLFDRGQQARSSSGATLTCTARSAAGGRTRVTFQASGYRGAELESSSFALTTATLTDEVAPEDAFADVVGSTTTLQLVFPTADSKRYPFLSFNPAPSGEEAFTFRCAS